MTSALTDSPSSQNPFGTYLRDRRAALDPATLGFPSGRRRTPGLRREEVAQRAGISTTWYICLEQGRGGPPSPEVLDGIAHALALTDAEREHLFLLGLGRPPEVRYRREEGISKRLQRILDALNPAPALIKTATWDLVGWNAATAALIDYGTIPPEHRNMLRIAFLDPRARAAQEDWPSAARTAVAAFRADAAKAGALAETGALVEELRRLSPEFDAMWRENGVLGGEAIVKRFLHPVLGPIDFDLSTFGVDGRQDLTMMVYHPTDEGDLARIERLISKKTRHKTNGDERAKAAGGRVP